MKTLNLLSNINISTVILCGGKSSRFNFNDKVNKINISYDDKTGNKFRRLNSWERDPNFSKLDNQGFYGIKFDYTPYLI